MFDNQVEKYGQTIRTIQTSGRSEIEEALKILESNTDDVDTESVQSAILVVARWYCFCIEMATVLKDRIQVFIDHGGVFVENPDTELTRIFTPRLKVSLDRWRELCEEYNVSGDLFDKTLSVTLSRVQKELGKDHPILDELRDNGFITISESFRIKRRKHDSSRNITDGKKK